MGGKDQVRDSGVAGSSHDLIMNFEAGSLNINK
jgi:hypothetical protein